MGAPPFAEGMFGDSHEAEISGIIGPIIVTPTPNRAAWTTRVVKIAMAGMPQQGPIVAIPSPFAVSITVRIPNAPAGAVGYVATSAVNAGDTTIRKELVPGQGFILNITNMNLLWFDSNVAAVEFELTVEQ